MAVEGAEGPLTVDIGCIVQAAYGFGAVMGDPEYPDVTVDGCDIIFICAWCGWIGYAKTPVVAGVVTVFLPGVGDVLVLVNGVGAAIVVVGDKLFRGSGVEVNGGGRGPPLRSPLTLLFKAGSNIECPLSFFLLPLPSFAPEPPAADSVLFASCSSSSCECFSSSFQKKPFPLSPPHRSNFKNARLEDKLWRTEL